MATEYDTGLIIGVLVFYAVILVFFIAVWWQIWRKAGYAGALSLLILVPLVNLISICYLAFSDWPVHKKLRALEGGTPRS